MVFVGATWGDKMLRAFAIVLSSSFLIFGSIGCAVQSSDSVSPERPSGGAASPLAAVDRRFKYEDAAALFSKSPYTIGDPNPTAFDPIGKVWLRIGTAWPGGSIYDEDGLLPVTYRGKKAFRQITTTFTDSRHFPGSEEESVDSWKYYHEDKTYISGTEGYSGVAYWGKEISPAIDGRRFIGLLNFFFIDKCSYMVRVKGLPNGTLLVKTELSHPKDNPKCSNLEWIHLYRTRFPLQKRRIGDQYRAPIRDPQSP